MLNRTSMLTMWIALLTLAMAVHAQDAETEAEAVDTVEAAEPAEAESFDHLSYTLGLMMGQQIQSQGIDGLVAEDFTSGVMTAVNGEEPKITQEQMQIVFMMLQQQAQAKQAERVQQMQELQATNVAEGDAFLAENTVKEGVVTTESGLQYKVLQAGEGESPVEGSVITVHYEGKLLDGTVFDSSYERGEPLVWDPAQFSLIPGWVEGLQLMQPGSIYEFYIPSDLAYGEHGQGQIPPGATLVFKVELLKAEAPAVSE